MLCYYLKNSVKEMSKGKSGESIFLIIKIKMLSMPSVEMPFMI